MDIEASIGLRLDGIAKNVDALAAEAEAMAQVREYERGRKFFRLPILHATPASSAVSFGGHTNDIYGVGPVTPDSGFIWSVRLLVINGMTASASSPDVIDIKIQGQRVWQLNGNVFAQTWSRGEMLMFPGEAFAYVNNGTFAATGTGAITAGGLVEQVPAEMMGKIF